MVGLERIGHDRFNQRALHRPERGRLRHGQATSGAISGTASVTILAPPTTSSTVAYSLAQFLEHRVPGRHHDHEHRHDDRSPTGSLQFNFAATITQIWNATVAEPFRHALRDPERRIQQHDRPGPERFVRLSGQPRRSAGGTVEFCRERIGKRHGTPPPSNTPAATVTFADIRRLGNRVHAAISRSPTTARSPISGWTLSFDFVGTISSIWNASIKSQSGNLTRSRTPHTTRS